MDRYVIQFTKTITKPNTIIDESISFQTEKLAKAYIRYLQENLTSNRYRFNFNYHKMNVKKIPNDIYEHIARYQLHKEHLNKLEEICI